MEPSTFTREVVVRPAYDRRHSDPSKNCGIHGCDLCFFLRGPLGAVHFIIYAGWHLPHVQADLDQKRRARFKRGVSGEIVFDGTERDVEYLTLAQDPMPADVGYHSPRPMFEDHRPASEDCEHLAGGGPCYVDGSALRAEESFWPILLKNGSEGVWKALEEEYRLRFIESGGVETTDGEGV